MKKLILNFSKTFYILNLVQSTCALTFENVIVHNIGQGQAITAKYQHEGKHITVVLDAGSSSSNTSEKFMQLKNFSLKPYSDLLVHKNENLAQQSGPNAPTQKDRIASIKSGLSAHQNFVPTLVQFARENGGFQFHANPSNQQEEGVAMSMSHEPQIANFSRQQSLTTRTKNRRVLKDRTSLEGKRSRTISENNDFNDDQVNDEEITSNTEERDMYKAQSSLKRHSYTVEEAKASKELSTTNNTAQAWDDDIAPISGQNTFSIIRSATLPGGKQTHLQAYQANENRRKAKQNLQNELQGTDYLILLLSHSDQDHINWVPEILDYSKSAKVLAILGGEWNGAPNQRNNGYNDFGVLNALKKHANAITILPAYSNDKSKLNQLYTQADSKIIPATNKTFFSGNIYDYLKHFGLQAKPLTFNTLQEDSAIPSNLGIGAGIATPSSFNEYSNGVLATQHFYMKSHSEPPLFGQQQNNDTEILNYIPPIDLLSVNFQSSGKTNPNEQSIVVALSVPTLQFTFVSTADAEPAAFSKIIAEREAKNLLHKGDLFPKNHLVIMMLPHHGSHENILTQNDIQKFRPDVLIASTDGLKFDHPRAAAIFDVIKHLFIKNEDKSYLQTFYNQLVPAFISYHANAELLPEYIANPDGRTKGLQMFTQHIVNPDTRILFLGTNTEGSIKIHPNNLASDTIRISTQNQYIIEHKNEAYLIDLSQHINKKEFDQKANNELKTKLPNLITYKEKTFKQTMLTNGQPIYYPETNDKRAASIILIPLKIGTVYHIYQAKLFNATTRVGELDKNALISAATST